jgi:hypothetical protein
MHLIPLSFNIVQRQCHGIPNPFPDADISRVCDPFYLIKDLWV